MADINNAKKKTRNEEPKYSQKYRSEWELKPEFSKWLSVSNSSENFAFCKVCRCQIQARFATIRLHGKSTKHTSLMSSVSGSSKLSKFFATDSKLTTETKKAELKFCAFLAEHNIPFRAMDHLSELISSTFYDSGIAKGFSCKRTKTAVLTYNVLAKSFKTELREQITATGTLGRKYVSLIIDKTTDKGTTKCMSIVVKFFSEKLLKVDTRLLNLVRVDGETAAELFETMENDLHKHGIEVKDLVGYTSDTTNVMFGQNNSIASHIMAANPHCLAIKCACHSCALAVSRACSVLPRHLEQVLKECYNYFAFLSKRSLEFKEFQDFTDSIQHRMLRFYNVRWLSLGNCVERIFTQWKALKLYFTSQYLVDHLQTSQFLYEQLSNPYTKLYFTFLNYVIPLVTKLNVIFQAKSPSVHNFHSHCVSAYKALLSCFVHPTVVRSHATVADPSDPANHLPLTKLYIGIEAAKMLATDEYKALEKEALAEYFRKCQQFYIELCCQLKKRLPLDNPVVKDLKFLDPQTVVSGSVPSIVGVASRFPNVVPPENLQSVDQEWREFMFDDEISTLADRCSTVPTEESWGKVPTDKYPNLTAFAKAMLTIPVSNADCERVFSQVNLIKTNQRNRFSTEGVASLLFVKDGIKNVAESCATFEPSDEMLSYFNNNIYRNVEAVYGLEADGVDAMAMQIDI